jgi:hypothetical protein
MKSLLFGAALAGVALSVVVSVAAAPGPELKVSSTLDGRTVLPHRIHWIGTTTLPPARIEEVDFLVDGKVRWVEHKAPYVYAADENGTKLGYLVTSWLSPGMHTFAVKAVAKDGRTATGTNRARVLPAPEPPGELAGPWHRTIDASIAPKPGSPGNPTGSVVASGRYTMTFEKRWVRDQEPGRWDYPQSNDTGNGLYMLNDYTAEPSRIHVVGEVVFHPYSERLPEGGSWCYFSGPPADYRWSVSGDTLTLTPIGGRDACGIRGFIWTGQWTRG